MLIFSVFSAVYIISGRRIHRHTHKRERPGNTYCRPSRRRDHSGFLRGKATKGFGSMIDPDANSELLYRSEEVLPDWYKTNIPCQVGCPARTDVSNYIGLIS